MRYSKADWTFPGVNITAPSSDSDAWARFNITDLLGAKTYPVATVSLIFTSQILTERGRRMHVLWPSMQSGNHGCHVTDSSSRDCSLPCSGKMYMLGPLASLCEPAHAQVQMHSAGKPCYKGFKQLRCAHVEARGAALKSVFGYMLGPSVQGAAKSYEQFPLNQAVGRNLSQRRLVLHVTPPLHQCCICLRPMQATSTTS